MKKKILSLCLIAVLCITAAAQSVTDVLSQGFALSFAKEACSDESGDYDYYVGENVQSILNEKYIYFLVDMQPGAGWEHSCKHVYVNINGQKNSTIVKDGVHPLAGISIKPAYVKKRYASKSALKVKVPKSASGSTNAENKFASHTYAVILSGGIDKTANEEHYWNDCSFLYQTLRNRYNVPKENIKVIMSDGTDPAEDMLTNEHKYVSSPLDLDGDGTPDIEYSATKENVEKVIKGLSQTLTDNDHLLLLVVDHGGYDKQKKQSYICLWGEDKIYPNELNQCLSAGDAGFVSVIMGQCYSGGFIDALKGNNRIVATACAEDEKSYSCEELPFDEFVYHFISALNGYDAEGNAIQAEDASKSVTTITDAISYAKEKDQYAEGMFPYANETPTYSWLSKSTAEDLSLDSIPPTVYLCITKGNTKIEKESNELAGFLSQNINNFAGAEKAVFWTSPDIWLRNEPDGFENQEYQMPNITDEHNTINIYTRIMNRGVKTYPGNGQDLHVWWASSSYVLDQKAWRGYRNNSMDGGEVDYVPVEETIVPGDSAIIWMDYTFKRKKLENAKKKGFNMCLLAYLTDSDGDPNLPVDNNDIVKSWETDRIAQKNEYKITCTKDSLISLPLLFQKENETEYSIAVINYANSKTGSNPLDIRLSLPSSANHKNLLLKNCMPNKTSLNEIRIDADKSLIRSVTTSKDILENMAFRASFKADNDITDTLRHYVDVAVIDENSGEIIGGERFEVVVGPRPKIVPSVSKTTNIDGTVELEACGIDEAVNYEWYDEKGNLVGTGHKLRINQVSAAGKYTLRVSAKSDNAFNTVDTMVDKIPFIKDITTSGAENVNVEFSVPAHKGMTAKLTNSQGNVPLIVKNIEAGVTSTSFTLPDTSNGVTQISIMKDGKIVDECKMINK